MADRLGWLQNVSGRILQALRERNPTCQATISANVEGLLSKGRTAATITFMMVAGIRRSIPTEETNGRFG